MYPRDAQIPTKLKTDAPEKRRDGFLTITPEGYITAVTP